MPIFAAERGDESWWSLQPVDRPDVPKVFDTSWARNPIDDFVLAKLELEGLKPRPEADKQTLTRRMYFDLIGLPPDLGVEGDVDALLASPRYGERWARH